MGEAIRMPNSIKPHVCVVICSCVRNVSQIEERCKQTQLRLSVGSGISFRCASEDDLKRHWRCLHVARLLVSNRKDYWLGKKPYLFSRMSTNLGWSESMYMYSPGIVYEAPALVDNSFKKVVVTGHYPSPMHWWFYRHQASGSIPIHANFNDLGICNNDLEAFLKQ